MTTPILSFPDQVSKFSPSLFPFALSLTRKQDEAQELLQETIYRALAAQEKFVPGTNLKAWLYTIMKNIFINNYRRRVRRKMVDELPVEEAPLNQTQNASPNLALQNMAIEDMLTAIETLKVEYKTPFMMHFNGFKYHEIAEHLSLPIGTVKSRLHFARRVLQRDLVRY